MQEINNIDNEIKELDTRKNELEYYENTMDILLNYYTNTSKTKTDNSTIIDINDLFKKKFHNFFFCIFIHRFDIHVIDRYQRWKFL